jgi:hypothetical protein
MDERERPGRGDISASEHGDFTDWDNPEDWDEEPDDYDDDYDPEDASYIPTPDDPDYDLTEAAGYANWEAPRRYSFELPRWLLVAVSILLILAMLTPVWIRIT